MEGKEDWGFTDADLMQAINKADQWWLTSCQKVAMEISEAGEGSAGQTTRELYTYMASDSKPVHTKGSRYASKINCERQTAKPMHLYANK